MLYGVGILLSVNQVAICPHKHSFRSLSDDWILGLRDKWEDRLFVLRQYMSERCLVSRELSKAIEYMEWAIHFFQPENEEVLNRIGDMYLRYSGLNRKM
ncbi:hypothetical protein D3C87_1851600 [compost metagenome]